MHHFALILLVLSHLPSGAESRAQRGGEPDHADRKAIARYIFPDTVRCQWLIQSVCMEAS